jgi:hypothetical protein
VRRVCTWTTCLALACVSFWPLASQATTSVTEAGDGETLCGPYFWFNVVGPKGWTRESGVYEDADYVRWDPPNSPLDSPLLLMSYLHVEIGRKKGRSSDPIELLRRQLYDFASHGVSGPIRDTDLRHPRLPSAAARMTGRSGSVTVVGVVAAAEEERGAYWTFLLLTPDKVPSAEHLRAFQATVESLRFEPERGCAESRSGGGARERVTYTPTPALPKSPSRKPGAKRPFSLKDSLAGATLVGRMMMPVTGAIVTVDGRRAYLIDFGPDERKTRAEYVEHFAPAIAANYCWEASAARPEDKVPLLVFTTDEPKQVRRWDCEKEALGPPQSAEIALVAPLALEIGGHAGHQGAAVTCSGGRLSCTK